MPLQRLLRLFGLCGFAAAAFCSSAASATQTRIAAIDSASVSTLPVGVSPRLTAAKDLGPADANLKLTQMSLRFSMTDAQQAALTQLIASQQNPASPLYHQWLTPEQFAAQFGLASDDLAKVSSWLTAQGFTVTSVSRGGLFVQFSGTVAQANRAFNVELHNVTLAGESHIANLTSPVLPKAIAAVTSAVTGLDDLRLKPHLQLSSVNDVAHPNYTTSSGVHYLAPGDFYTIYDVKPLLSSSINGSGVKVAIVGQTDVNLSDLAAFRTASGLAANVPTVVLSGTDPGVPSTGDLYEAELDLEWSAAVAPSASFFYVNSVDVINGSLTYAIDNNLAPIISNSYGDCEADLGVSALIYYNALLQMAASQGQTVVSASGDSGATDCDYNVATATNGLAVDFPASSPLVIGVGGTTLSEGTGTYWSSTNGTNNGSALSYIPEVVWNDDNSSVLASSGGGASAYFAKPSWQAGTGVPADYSRDVPDVALAASPNHDPYLLCVPNFCSSGYASASGGLTVVGGTSVGAPSFAGLLALVEQKTGSRIGVANNTIYALAGSSYAGSVFHDVTSGNNASPCKAGTTNCANGGTIGFSATAKYDQTTGWGSVDAFALVNDWALVTPLVTTGGTTGTYTTLSGSATTVTQGTTVNLTATVTAASGSSVPTGSVEITVDSIAVASAALNGSGVATYTLATTSLTAGNHTVQATYLGDSTFAGSKGAFVLTVSTTSAATFTLSPATATITTKAGTQAPGLLLTVAAQNGFAGSIQFAAATPAALAAEYSFTVNPVTLSSTNTSGTTTLNLFAYTGTPSLSIKTASISTPATTMTRAVTGLAMAGIVCMLFPRRRRFSALLLALLAAGVVSLSGCQYSTPQTTTTLTPTPTGTYTVTVSATGTMNGNTITQYSTVMFTVQ